MSDRNTQHRPVLQLNQFIVLRQLTLGEDSYHLDFLTRSIGTISPMFSLSCLSLEIGIIDNLFHWDAWDRLWDKIGHLFSKPPIIVVVKLFIWDSTHNVEARESWNISFICKLFSAVPHVEMVIATPTETLEYIKFRVP